MNMYKNILAAAALGALLSGAAVAKPMMQDHALDKTGDQVMDARGNCVLTKWQSDHGACGKYRSKLTGMAREARTVYFDFNKATIKASEKKKLDSLIAAVKESKDVESVDIVGFADMIGTDNYNARLSKKRADAVKQYLASKGGIKSRNISVQGLGETHSVTRCEDSLPREQLIACLAEDRRVEIQFNFIKK